MLLLLCCTDNANGRAECTKELSDASHAATNMHRWRVLAWFLGSAASSNGGLPSLSCLYQELPRLQQ